MAADLIARRAELACKLAELQRLAANEGSKMTAANPLKWHAPAWRTATSQLRYDAK